ncbi:hypothetical protein ACFV5N_11780 [Streptomyces sp. NPDC059853]|uniref:hypothetical protein n=1 Tax=Streptomyces sp. NPDC059853 TaxID=3346973 RepID=UPI0036662996
MTSPALDWSDSRHWNPAGPAPCVLCGRPAHLLSDRGRPCHKTCAEGWLAARAAAPDSGALTDAA